MGNLLLVSVGRFRGHTLEADVVAGPAATGLVKVLKTN